MKKQLTNLKEYLISRLWTDEVQNIVGALIITIAMFLVLWFAFWLSPTIPPTAGL